MKGLEVHNQCSGADDMLAYLYDEISEAHREKFEMHLASCGTCVDDFAEISQSRYPVYEWKRAQFDQLPTPRFVLPLKLASPSPFVDRLRAAFSLTPSFAFGGLTAAVLVALVGGYVIFVGVSSDAEVAREMVPAPVANRASIALPSPPVLEPLASEGTEIQKNAELPKNLSNVVKTSTAVKAVIRSTKPKAKSVRRTIQKDQIPVMSSIEDDEEDDTLRLADIFDEIGTSE